MQVSSVPVKIHLILKTKSLQVTAQKMSGNPGYRTGAPLLAGRRVSKESDAVSRFVNGIPLMTPALDGTCSPAVDTSPYVQFGSDTLSACTLMMTLAQLKRFCLGGDVPGAPGATLPIPEYFSGKLFGSELGLLVGVWGNSSAAEPSQWMTVQHSAPGVLTGEHTSETSHEHAIGSCSDALIRY